MRWTWQVFALLCLYNINMFVRWPSNNSDNVRGNCNIFVCETLQHFSCVKLCSMHFLMTNERNGIELADYGCNKPTFLSKKQTATTFCHARLLQTNGTPKHTRTSTVTTNGLSTRQDTQHIECDNNSFKLHTIALPPCVAVVLRSWSTLLCHPRLKRHFTPMQSNLGFQCQ